MTSQLHDDPDDLVLDALAGIEAEHPTLLQVHRDPLFVARATAPSTPRVAIVSGGGSGHEPLHTGFVGSGMLDAAVPGQVFASPTTRQVLAAIKHVDQGEGTLLLVKQYTGDVLNFRLAAERAADDGITVETVLIDDDLATDDAPTGRRGTGAVVAVERLAGAVAAQGASLAEVTAIARDTVARSRSVAVAFRSATLPGQQTPSFAVEDGHVEMGVGIHGERGTAQAAYANGSALIDALASRVVDALGLVSGDEVIALVNGLGGTPLLQLAAGRHYLGRALSSRGITIARSLTGSYVTALDMQGVSLSLTKVADGDLARWDQSLSTSALAW